MIFKNHEELDDTAKQTGLAVISTFSSIRAIAKMGIPFEGMVLLNQLIAEIDCVLWSIVPLALQVKHKAECADQIKNLQQIIASFIKASEAMGGLMQAFKDEEKESE
jgi:hypothetical protein